MKKYKNGQLITLQHIVFRIVHNPWSSNIPCCANCRISLNRQISLYHFPCEFCMKYLDITQALKLIKITKTLKKK